MIKYRDPVTGKWEKLPYIPGNSGLPAVTPEMYGAKGDGKTDDTEAIQKAVDHCGTQDAMGKVLPGTVYFSNRTYRITRPIVASKKINIQGRQCVIDVDSDEVIDAALDFQSQGDEHRTVLRDVTVRCNGKAKNGLRIGSGDRDDTHTTQITVDNCYVTGATEDGFKLVPMAYCIRFQSCFAMSNGGSGISVVAPDSSHQMNAVTIDGCSLLMNGRHGVHVSGVHIVVENCIIELNGIYSIKEEDVLKYYYVDAANKTGSGVYVGVPGYASQNIVIQNNYFEPSADAQVTASSSYVSVRVLNNYFLSDTGKKPEGHSVTHVKCVHSGDEDSAVNLHFRNNTAAGSDRTDVDGGNVLDQFSVVDAEFVKNAKCTNLTRPPLQGVRHFIPLSLSSGTPHEKGIDNKSVNLVTDDVKKIAIVLPFTMFNCVFRLMGFHAITDGTTATIRNRIHVKDASGTLLKGTYFDHTLSESKQYVGNVMNNNGYYNIPNNSFVEVTFELTSAGNATSVVISNPFIDIYNP